MEPQKYLFDMMNNSLDRAIENLEKVSEALKKLNEAFKSEEQGDVIKPDEAEADSLITKEQ